MGRTGVSSSVARITVMESRNSLGHPEPDQGAGGRFAADGEERVVGQHGILGDEGVEGRSAGDRRLERRARVRHVEQRDEAGERGRVAAGNAPNRTPVGDSAVIRMPMASVLSPPGASRSFAASAPMNRDEKAPVLTESGTAMLSMRLESTSWASMSAKVRVLSIASGCGSR